jgi:phage replication initiation protein
VRVIGLPRRINSSSLAAGVTWDDVQSQHQRLRK